MNLNPGVGVEVLLNNSFPSSTLPILLDQVSCTGSELSISQCSALRGAFTCPSDHSKDAALRCLGMVINGGIYALMREGYILVGIS